MKNSVFKYIFIVFVIGIIVFTIYMIYIKKDEPKNEVIQLPVEEITEGKELHLGISNFDTINPLLTNNKEVINIDKLIFEPLLTIDEDYKIKLCLATEWSKTSPTSYIIKIDNNKRWSDGTPMISKDIQFTIDRIKEGTSVYSYNVQKISGVQVLDASTVRIDLFEEDPFFEYNLTFPILPNNYYIGESFKDSSKTPIGTRNV